LLTYCRDEHPESTVVIEDWKQVALDGEWEPRLWIVNPSEMISGQSKAATSMTLNTTRLFELKPTIAMKRGEVRLEQCAFCGLLAAVTSNADAKKLGVCPACGKDEWWAQTLPVGPFRSLVNLEGDES
jgi:hypothetical protein